MYINYFILSFLVVLSVQAMEDHPGTEKSSGQKRKHVDSQDTNQRKKKKPMSEKAFLESLPKIPSIVCYVTCLSSPGYEPAYQAQLYVELAQQLEEAQWVYYSLQSYLRAINLKGEDGSYALKGKLRQETLSTCSKLNKKYQVAKRKYQNSKHFQEGQ